MIHDAVVHKITRRNPFLQDWPYYARIDILNPVATAQYQHSVTIASKPGMMHDFRDLRFFQPDGTEIPFWIESKTDGSTSFSWFKPYSPSQKNVYCFYGNGNAVSQSNGEKTFEFFDDFLGSALDATKWDSSGSGITVGSSNVTISSAVGNIIGKTAFSTYGYAYRFSAALVSYNSGNPVIGGADSLSFNTYVIFDGYEASSSGYYTLTHITNPNEQYNIGTTAYTNVHTWEIQYRTTTSRVFLIDGTPVGTTHTSALNATHKPLIRNGSSTSGMYVVVDWILVRKYPATEPVCQLNQSGLRNPAYR